MRIFLVCFIALILAGCVYNDSNFEHTICDCKGIKVDNINDEAGVVASTVDGFRIISVNRGYIAPCNEIPIDYQFDGALIYFSGQMISKCIKERPGYGIWLSHLIVGSIKKADTLFVNESPQIRIIRTEDYGYQPGFGYMIYDVEKKFRILQPTVPNDIPGIHVFKTYNDAVKTAFVVAYKLKNFNDLPSIQLGDLYYLQIQGI